MSRAFFDMVDERGCVTMANSENSIGGVVDFTMRLCVPSQITTRSPGGTEQGGR